MAAQLIDGVALSQKLRDQFAHETQALVARGTRPGLAVILVGDDPASQVYVRNKVKACEQAGFHSVLDRQPANLSESELLARVDPRIYDAALRQQTANLKTRQAEVARAKAQLQQAINDEKRAFKLRDDQLIVPELYAWLGAIGAALFEHCIYDERGQLLNGNMADYLVPMAMEMPVMKISDAKYNSTDISGNYADFAKAMGGYGERITEPGEIAAALKRGIAKTRDGVPTILEFITRKETRSPTYGRAAH